ncbi:uncharacterized protein LOC144746276 [Ciona intestinalis]
MALPSWSEYLNQQFESHATEVNSCVLAQPCHDNSSIDQFYKSLKKGKKKHPELVALYKVADGIILMFRSQPDAVQYIDKYSSNIDNRKKMKFYKRDIPTLCTDRLAIQNVGSNTSEETLSLLLESHIEPEPKQLTPCSKAGSYLAFYPPGTDVTSGASKMDGVVFEDSKLKVDLIYPTNCILVSNMPPSTSEKEIARCFMNFDQSLYITRIVRRSRTSAVVHFLQCNDAEMICTKFESGRWKPLHGDCKLSLFYDRFENQSEQQPGNTSPVSEQFASEIDNLSLEGELEEESPQYNDGVTVATTSNSSQNSGLEFPIKGGQNMVNYFGEKELLSNIRRQLLTTGVEVDLVKNKGAVHVVVETEDRELSNDIKKLLKQFFDEYSSTSVSLKQKNVDWLNNTGITWVPIEGSDKVKVYVQVTNDSVVITGKVNDVNLVLDKLNIDFAKETDEFYIPSNNFRLVHSFGIVDDIKRKYENCLEIDSDFDRSLLKFQGSSEHIENAKSSIAMQFLLHDTQHAGIPEIPPNQNVYHRIPETSATPTPSTQSSGNLFQERYSITTSNGVRVSVGMGNVAIQDTDVIVNAANDCLENGVGVTGAIFKQGGHAFKNECQNAMRARRGQRLAVGEAVMVNATGNLKCRNVIHLVGPQWHNYRDKNKCSSVLIEGIMSVLVQASSVNAKTIAIPPVSTGVYGVPVQVFVEMVKKCIRILEQRNDIMLKQIRILSIDEPTVRKLVDGFKKSAATGFESQAYSQTKTHSYSQYGAGKMNMNSLLPAFSQPHVHYRHPNPVQHGNSSNDHMFSVNRVETKYYKTWMISVQPDYRNPWKFQYGLPDTSLTPACIDGIKRLFHRQMLFYKRSDGRFECKLSLKRFSTDIQFDGDHVERILSDIRRLETGK